MKNITNTLIAEFSDKEYAHGYMEGHLDSCLAAQVHAIRKQRGLSVDQLAEQSGLTSEIISAIESDDFEFLSVDILKKLSKAFDVNLRIEFKSFVDGISRAARLENFEVKGRVDDLKDHLEAHQECRAILFNQWVNDNNPAETLNYRKGWWDFVEFIQRLTNLFNPVEVSTISTFILNTPPPTEQIEMPVVLMEFEGASFVIKLDFSRIIGGQWEISVTRNDHSKSENVECFISKDAVIRDKYTSIPAEYIFGAYDESAKQFSCCVGEEMDVYAIIRIVLQSRSVD